MLLFSNSNLWSLMIYDVQGVAKIGQAKTAASIYSELGFKT